MTCQTVGMRHSRTPRVARGAVVASVATFTALMSHIAAGGTVPGVLGIAAPWLLALMVSTLLAGRSLSLTRLGVSVAASQLLFHTLFVVGSPNLGGAAAMSHHDHGAMAAHMDAGATGTAGAAGTGASGVAALLTALCADPLMWGVHAAAAVVTVALLYRGEHSVRALLALARDIRDWARRVVTRAVPLAPFPVSTEASATAFGWIVRPAAHIDDRRRRGPPTPITL